MSYQFPTAQYNTMDSTNGSSQQGSMDPSNPAGNGSAVSGQFNSGSGNLQAGSDGSRVSKSTLWFVSSLSLLRIM